MFQKELYPTFSVIFVTTLTLWVACVFMFLTVIAWTRQFSIHWGDWKTLACLLYSAFVGQFLLYITSNASNKALSAPMICLAAGIQPIATPWMDLIRLCQFPDVHSGECEYPPRAILFCCFMVVLGLGLFAWGEYEVLENIKKHFPNYNRFQIVDGVDISGMNTLSSSRTLTEIFTDSFEEPLLTTDPNTDPLMLSFETDSDNGSRSRTNTLSGQVFPREQIDDDIRK